MADEADEDYWTTPQKRRNFFDDKPLSPTEHDGSGRKEAVSFKQSLKEAGLDDDTQDTVRLEAGVPKFSAGRPPDRPTTGPTYQSARGTVAKTGTLGSGASTPVSIQTSRPGQNGNLGTSKQSAPPPTSSSSTAQPSGEGLFGHKRSVSATIVERKNASQTSSPLSSHGSTHGSTASMDEAGRKDSRPSMTEVAKLQAEINTLHRKIRSLEKSRWSALPVADTVSRIITGERYSLEPYKSLKDKQSLLDAAIGFHDGNAIIAIVCFLKKTLSKTLFHQELSKRPEAVNQYIAFLKAYHTKDENVANELGALGRPEEAALWRYKLANQSKVPQTRLHDLTRCNSMWFQNVESRTTEHDLIKEQILLLNKQLQIEPRDERLQREGRPQFREVPRKSTLYFQPAMTTLFYCCLYHYNSPEADMSNPLVVKKEFNMTDKQYLFQALLARARVKKWSDVEGLLTSKNWLGKARMKAAVNFEQVVYILQTARAPSEEVGKYMMFIEDKENRMAMAIKLKHPVVVIDTLAQLKDRQRLLAYRSQCGTGTPADTHAEIVLRNPEQKWKN